ncbi:hypothetical protein ACFV9W_25355 [Streptomyces sp. NPDC059897]|uniref:hypothetical protein n=1 Tax=Streptomyces sp. NPDC059897 TaxID=3346994 RepID=UPI00364CF179
MGESSGGAAVRRPVAGEIQLHYGQAYIESGSDFAPELQETFAGQRSGLCGAAVPGFLFLITGLHTGDVGFTVEVHEREPALAPDWEDVVEVSFRPASERTCLTQWAGEAAWELGLDPVDHRVRYCAYGMDAGSDLDTRIDEPQADRYLIQFWPAPAAPDRIVRQTSEAAEYWHGVARRTPPPPTAEERAEQECRARAAQERAELERHLEHERHAWGGRSPSDNLRTVEAAAWGLLRFDAALVHELDAVDAEAQRAVAVHAARRACAIAGIAELSWVAPALAALDEGRALPAPFDDRDEMFRTLASDPRVPDRQARRAVPPTEPEPGPGAMLVVGPARDGLHGGLHGARGGAASGVPAAHGTSRRCGRR